MHTEVSRKSRILLVKMGETVSTVAIMFIQKKTLNVETDT